MKKLSKKLTSLALAMVMLVSALPFTPIIAEATSPTLLAQYFTTNDYRYDAVSGQNKLTLGAGTVTSSNDGTATFAAAYLSADTSSLFSEVSADNGFTVSFNIKTTAPTTQHQHVVSFGKYNNSINNSFYVTASTTWFYTDSAFTSVYVNSSGNENNLQGRIKSADAPSTTSTSAPYNVTIVYTRTGMTYYIDGVKYCDYEYRSGSASNLQNILDEFSTYGYTYIGGSRYKIINNLSDPYFTGTLRDLRFYKGAMTEEQVQNEFVKYTVGSDWDLVSSTDFENASWLSKNSTGSGFTSTDGSNNYMQWYGTEYENSVTKPDNSEDGSGVKLDNGYLYMNGYTTDGSNFSTSGTPITGADCFLLDMQFRYYTASNLNSDGYSLINILTNGNYDTSLTHDAGPSVNENIFFNQLCNGQINIEGQLSAATGENCSTENSKISANVAYHYIIEYKEKVLKAYITDAYGNRLIDYGTIESDDFDTSAITAIRIGDDDTAYYIRYLEVDNINLYTQDASTGTEKDHYLFPYFTGNADATATYSSTQALRFAVSTDCQTFTALNNNYPVINQTGSTTSYNCRDPYIIEGQDGYYYIIGTDESYADSAWGKSAHRFVLWRSTDLVNWEEYDVDLYDLPNCNTNSNYINYAWAPEIFWDSSVNKYMIYFAFQDDTHTEAQCGTDKQELYYIYATDLFDISTWEEPQLLFNAYALDGGACIDADITEIDGTYYMFYKSEGKGSICIVKSDSLTGPYTQQLILNHGYSYGATEGCQVWIDNDGNIRYLADCYGLNLGFAVYNFGKNIEALYSKGYYGTMTYDCSGDTPDFSVTGFMVDISNYYDTVSNTSFNVFTPRHGSVIKITEAQYNALIRANSNGLFNNATEDKSGTDLDIEDNLILRYLVDDVSSNTGKTPESYSLSGTATWSNNAYMNRLGAAYFNGGYLTADVGTEISSNANTSTGLTISFYAKPNYTAAKDSRFFELANYGVAAGTWNDLNGTANYISMYQSGAGSNDSCKRGYIEIASGNYNNRSWQMGTLPYSLGGGWHLYTITISGTTMSKYIDGVLINSITNSVFDSTLYNGLTHVNLGGAIWNSDPYFTGWMRDFRVYNVGLTSAQVAELPALYYQDSAGAAANYEDLDTAIAAYEAIIAEMAQYGYSRVYTNLVDGYIAYKNAVTAKASGTAADKAEALTAMNEALTNMKLFSAHKGTNTPTIGGSSVGTDYYKNVIYSEGALESEGTAYDGFSDDAMTELYTSHIGMWKYGAYAYIYYQNSVVLYDGVNTPMVPVIAGFINKDDRYDVDILYLNEGMNDFGLVNERWKGYTDSTTITWPSSDTNQVTTDSENTSSDYGMWTIDESVENDENLYRIIKNGITYTATPTTAYTCYSSTNWGIKYEDDFTSKTTTATTINNSIPDIVVINYKMLTDALSTAADSATNKGYLANLTTKYKSSGLEQLFAAYDSATSLNPNSGCTYYDHDYTYSTDMDAAALLCAHDIEASVLLLGDIRITTSDAKYQRLVQAIEDYETKMENMTDVYTNLVTAYEAYMVAVEYADAFYYGNRTSESDYTNPTLDEAALALETATDNMVPYTERTWDGVAFYGTNDAGEGVGYSNVVYSSNASNTWSSDVNDGYTYYSITTSSNTVMVYDGDNTKVYYPVALRTKCNNAHYTRVCAGVLSATNFSLNEVWRGYKSGDTGLNNFYWLEPTDDYYDNNSNYEYTWKGDNYWDRNSEHTLNYAGDYTIVNGMMENTGTYRYFYNILRYTGSGNSTDYYEKLSTISATFYGLNHDWGRKETSKSTSYTGTSAYVINYNPLKEKLATISVEGITISDYQEGGLKSWFEKLDTLTAIDPNQYDATSHPNGYKYSEGEKYTGGNSYTSYTGTEGAVVHCADDIMVALTQTSSISTTVPTNTEDTKTSGDVYVNGVLQSIDTENNGAYTNLKISLEEVKTAPTEQGCITNGTWTAYNDAISTAQAAMSYIAESNTSTYGDKHGYDEAYSDATYSANEINDIAVALDEALGELYKLSNSSHPLIFSYQLAGTHTAYFQCCSNNAHGLRVVDGVVDTTSPADMTNYDTLSMIYSTLDLTKYSNLETINEGKNTFNAVKTTAGEAGQTPQQIVDAGTAALLNAINSANETYGSESSVVDSFTVTVNVYEYGQDGYSTTSLGTDTITQRYGSATTIDITSEAWLTRMTAIDSNIDNDADNVQVEKWVVGGRDVVQQAPTTSLTIYSTADITVNAYIRNTTPADNYVYINNLASNRLYEVGIDSDNTTIVIYNTENESGNSINNIIIGGHTYTVPNSLTYNVTGWVINGTSYAASNETYLINSTFGALKGNSNTLTIRPIKEMNTAQYDSGQLKKFYVKLDGVNLVTDVNYDYRLSFTSSVENCYAIILNDSETDKFIPVAYGNSYNFYINRNMDFYSLVKDPETGAYTYTLGEETKQITDEETLFYLNNKLPVVCSYSEITGNITTAATSSTPAYGDKWTTRTAFTTNVGGGNVGTVTITECGTLRTTANVDASVLTIENVGTNSIVCKVNTNRFAGSNQYSYSLSSSSNAVVKTRAYVKYEYTYGGKTIDAIAYGPVCTSYYGSPT